MLYSHFVALAPGKTGSSTLTVSFNAYHTHGTDFEQRTKTKYGSMDNLYKEIRLKYKKKPIIVGSVREPVGRRISAFFENFTKYLSFDEAEQMDIDDLIKFFKENNKHGYYNPYSVENYQSDLAGINILNTPFDHEKKVLKYENDDLKIYIFRFEDIKNWPSIISNALDTKDKPYFKYKTSNLSSNKNYSQLYNKFKNRYYELITKEEIDQILNSEKDMYEHFYSKEEINHFYLNKK